MTLKGQCSACYGDLLAGSCEYCEGRNWTVVTPKGIVLGTQLTRTEADDLVRMVDRHKGAGSAKTIESRDMIDALRVRRETVVGRQQRAFDAFIERLNQGRLGEFADGGELSGAEISLLRRIVDFVAKDDEADDAFNRAVRAARTLERECQGV